MALAALTMLRALAASRASRASRALAASRAFGSKTPPALYLHRFPHQINTPEYEVRRTGSAPLQSYATAAAASSLERDRRSPASSGHRVRGLRLQQMVPVTATMCQ